MSPQALLWLILGLVVIVVAHELAHVAVARAHGHRVICVAFNPIGVAVVFEDTPDPRYWLLQLALPSLASWLLGIAWLFGLFALFGPGVAPPLSPQPATLLAAGTLLTVLTGAGDIAAYVMERRRPLWGDERVVRDFRLLRKLPALVLFTSYGRRWEPAWRQLGRPKAAGLGT